MQCLNFLQHLLLMEALNELTSSVRNRVAAGEILLQETLQELETIEKLLDTGTVHIAAFRTELDTLIPLASSLIAQTALAWTTWRRSHRYDYQWMTPVEKKELRAGYVYGYAEGVAQRIKSSRQEAVQERTNSGDTSTALVLRTKEQRLEDHMNSLNLGAPKDLTLDPAGVADGHDDGWASGLGSPTNKTIKDLNPNLITQ